MTGQDAGLAQLGVQIGAGAAIFQGLAGVQLFFLDGLALLDPLQAVRRRADARVGAGRVQGDRGLGPLDRVVDLDDVDLATERLDLLVGGGDGRAQTRLGRLHVLDQRAAAGDLDLQLGDAGGDLAGQVGLALSQGGAGRAFVLGDLVAEAGHLIFGHAATRHQAGQVVARLALGVVGVADFLIENLQGVGVDDALGRIMGRAAEQGGEFSEHGHGRVFRIRRLRRRRFRAVRWRRSHSRPGCAVRSVWSGASSCTTARPSTHTRPRRRRW